MLASSCAECRSAIYSPYSEDTKLNGALSVYGTS